MGSNVNEQPYISNLNVCKVTNTVFKLYIWQASEDCETRTLNIGACQLYSLGLHVKSRKISTLYTLQRCYNNARFSNKDHNQRYVIPETCEANKHAKTTPCC